MEMFVRRFVTLMLFALISTHAANADKLLPGALLEPDWLIKNLKDSSLTVIDIQEPEMFSRHHIPGAINWPFSQWRSGAEGSPPVSLLSLERMSERLGKLGIAADTPLVIVALGAGPGDLSASARVYWTMKVLGHEQVAILNGGLASYVNDHRQPYESGAAATREAMEYLASPNLDLLATAQWLKDAGMPRLDARSQAEYIGLVSGGVSERPGTLPGAHHLPFDWMSDANSGRLRPLEQLQALFQHAGLNDQAAVHFCHTGNRASLTWFVDYAMLGNSEARLYDGSMLEWAQDTGLPVDRKIKL